MSTTTIQTRYIMVNGVETLITAALCRTKVAELRAKALEAAMTPDTGLTGRRLFKIEKMRDALARQLMIWEQLLYEYSCGAEGSQPGHILTPT